MTTFTIATMIINASTTTGPVMQTNGRLIQELVGHLNESGLDNFGDFKSMGDDHFIEIFAPNLYLLGNTARTVTKRLTGTTRKV